nr:hypothetical protein [Tanacetum cinerariifolium]
MNNTQAQQKALDDALVAYADRLEAFSTIINKCLCGKETGMDKIRLSRAQILWDIFSKKNIDYVYLLWEDLLFQIDNKDAKKTNKMSYPRFTKFIIDYFIWLPKEARHNFTSHVSGSDDGVDTQSKIPDEQHLKTTGADEGTDTILGVPDVPIYESESEKESWGDSKDKDDVNDFDDISDEGYNDNYSNNGNDGDDDANDDDKQESDDKNDDDEETGIDRTESDRIKILVLDQSTTEFYEEEEEKINDEETMDEKEDDEVTKELHNDVNMNLRNEDSEMTNVDQGASEQQNAS